MQIFSHPHSLEDGCLLYKQQPENSIEHAQSLSLCTLYKLSFMKFCSACPIKLIKLRVSKKAFQITACAHRKRRRNNEINLMIPTCQLFSCMLPAAPRARLSNFFAHGHCQNCEIRRLVCQ